MLIILEHHDVHMLPVSTEEFDINDTEARSLELLLKLCRYLEVCIDLGRFETKLTKNKGD